MAVAKILTKKEFKKRKNINPAERKDWWFCVSILALPIINFIVFNMGNIVNMFRLAFTPDGAGTGVFYNFEQVIKNFTSNKDLLVAVRNSAIFYALGWLFTLPNMFTSYYIYNKFPGAKYFQVMLMLPGMVAAMVWVLVFKYFVDLVLPGWLGWEMGLLTNGNTKFLAILLYYVWTSLGVNLVYTGMMGSVSPEVREAGRLDGMNRVQEFVKLMLPAIYPLFVLSVVSGIIGFFTMTGSAFEFFGLDAPNSTYTIGYIMFQKVMVSGEYGFNAAGSLMFTAIVAPIALTVKRLMEKHGPRED